MTDAQQYSLQIEEQPGAPPGSHNEQIFQGEEAPPPPPPAAVPGAHPGSASLVPPDLPALQLTLESLLLLIGEQVHAQEAVQRIHWKKEQHWRDSLEAIQAIAGVVAQVTFMRTVADHNAGSFLWVCNVLAFTLSITVGMLAVGERMLMQATELAPMGTNAAAVRSGSAKRRLKLAAITMAVSVAFTLLTFAASQLSEENITLSLFLEARILLPLGAPLLLFSIVFVSFLISRLSL